LKPRSPGDLVDKVRRTGLSAVQLALDPLRTGQWPAKETAAILAGCGIEIRSGMMAMRGEDYSTLESIRRTGGVSPAEHWPANLAAAQENAALAADLGIKLVTFHAGFLPHEHDDPLRRTMLERVRAVADCFAERDVRVGLETGQETAGTLAGVLDELDRPNVGVNFDPANMILYDMGDPVEAIEKLAPRVLQIHIKDALPPLHADSWGEEIEVGCGDVDWEEFFDVLLEAGLRCDLMIERESGQDRAAEVALARRFVLGWIGTDGSERP